MKRKRNKTQMKEQTRNTEVQINEEEIGKLPEKEFRIMIVKMIKNPENKMGKMQESILQCSAFFTVQLSHPYMTTGKTIALTRWILLAK